MITELRHFGVLGMKWGRRKGSDNSSSDHKTAQSLKTKKLDELTNDELKILTNRMQLERSFKEARKQDLSPSKKYVSDILGQAGKQVAAQYVAKYMSSGVDLIAGVIKAKLKK